MAKIFKSFLNLKIRTKLLAGYTLIFISSILIGGAFIYSNVRKTIETNIERELTNSTETILNMVRTAAGTSIKNHLRAVAERNRDIVLMIYRDFKNGKLSEREAKKLARKILFSQRIGDTGYIFCGNSEGIAIEHPNPGIVGKNFMEMEFVKKMMVTKNGYLEYGWKNPEDKNLRPKAMYMSYFKEWDWIICASSYRSEFNRLVNVKDFEKSVLSLRFGKTGYAFIFNSKGEIIIHPYTESNYSGLRDETGQFFLKKIMDTKNGKLTYSWKNPGEKEFRRKMVIFNYIPEYDWVVASAIYLDEIYRPLRTVRNIIIVTILVILLLVLLASFGINYSVIKPIKSLIDQLSMGARGDLKIRMEVQSKDEIGELAGYFNSFMEKLEQYSENLEMKIIEQERSEKALKLSEEMFSKAFRSSPSGMFIATIKDVQIINVNDSFLRITGQSLFDLIGKELINLRFFHSAKEGKKIIGKISTGHKKPISFSFFNITGEKRSGTISSEKVQVWGESCILVVIEDTTEARQLEREILNISEKERQKIAMELHDDLCPQLIGIEVLLKILKEKLAKNHEEDAESADRIRNLVVDSIKKTRQLSMGLFPVNLDEKGFNTSLEDLVAYIKDTFKVSLELNYDMKEPLNDNSTASNIYYIIHEAVHNSLKHSNPEKIIIDIDGYGDIFKVRIRDNGKGFVNSDTIGTGIGMKIMQYRASKIGALLEIKSDNKGTEVNLELNS